MGHFCSLLRERFFFFSLTALDCHHESSPRRARIMTKLERVYAPLCVESSLPSSRAVGGLFLEISLGTWGPDPVLYHLFAIQNRRSFPIRKKSSRNWSGSHVPGKTSRHRPPTTLKLDGEDSQLSGEYALQVWWRKVSCEARTRGNGEVLCAKSEKHFFLV